MNRVEFALGVSVVLLSLFAMLTIFTGVGMSRTMPGRYAWNGAGRSYYFMAFLPVMGIAAIAHGKRRSKTSEWTLGLVVLMLSLFSWWWIPLNIYDGSEFFKGGLMDELILTLWPLITFIFLGTALTVDSKHAVILPANTKLQFFTALACSIFVISIFTPFLKALWFGESIVRERAVPETFWSFKGTYGYYRTDKVWGMEEWWFVDYWYRAGIRTSLLELWIGPFLIFMLEAQVLAVLFSTIAIFNVKPYLILSSTILNVFTNFCMWFVSNALNYGYLRTFEAGFWFAFISAALFLVAFLLSWKWLPKAT